MNFREYTAQIEEVLIELNRVSGIAGSLVVNSDGKILTGIYGTDEYVPLLEYNGKKLLNKSVKLLERAKQGKLKQILIETRKGNLIFNNINDTLFLFIETGSGAYMVKVMNAVEDAINKIHEWNFEPENNPDHPEINYQTLAADKKESEDQYIFNGVKTIPKKPDEIPEIVAQTEPSNLEKIKVKGEYFFNGIKTMPLTSPKKDVNQSPETSKKVTPTIKKSDFAPSGPVAEIKVSNQENTIKVSQQSDVSRKVRTEKPHPPHINKMERSKNEPYIPTSKLEALVEEKLKQIKIPQKDDKKQHQTSAPVSKQTTRPVEKREKSVDETIPIFEENHFNIPGEPDPQNEVILLEKIKDLTTLVRSAKDEIPLEDDKKTSEKKEVEISPPPLKIPDDEKNISKVFTNKSIKIAAPPIKTQKTASTIQPIKSQNTGNNTPPPIGSKKTGNTSPPPVNKKPVQVKGHLAKFKKIEKEVKKEQVVRRKRQPSKARNVKSGLDPTFDMAKSITEKANLKMEENQKEKPVDKLFGFLKGKPKNETAPPKKAPTLLVHETTPIQKISSNIMAKSITNVSLNNVLEPTDEQKTGILDLFKVSTKPEKEEKPEKKKKKKRKTKKKVLKLEEKDKDGDEKSPAFSRMKKIKLDNVEPVISQEEAPKYDGLRALIGIILFSAYFGLSFVVIYYLYGQSISWWYLLTIVPWVCVIFDGGDRLIRYFMELKKQFNRIKYVKHMKNSQMLQKYEQFPALTRNLTYSPPRYSDSLQHFDLKPYVILAAVYNIEDEWDKLWPHLKHFKDHLFFVDDISKDNTMEVVSRAGVKIIPNPIKTNKPGGLLYGISKLDPDIETVVVIDPDIELPDRVTLERAIFDQQRSGAGAVGVQVLPSMNQEHNVLWRCQYVEYSDSMSFGKTAQHDSIFLSGAAAIFDKEVLKQHLLMSSRSVYAEDLEISMLILISDLRTYFDKRVIFSTDVPLTLQRITLQRIGWHFGMLRVAIPYILKARTKKDTLFYYNFYFYILIINILIHPLKVLAIFSYVISLFAFLLGFIFPELLQYQFMSLSSIILISLFYIILSADSLIWSPDFSYRDIGTILYFALYKGYLNLLPITIGYLNYFLYFFFEKKLVNDPYEKTDTILGR